MASLQAWNTIVSKLKGNPMEIPTVPKTKRNPVWFFAIAVGENIFIIQASDNKPSSQLSMQRRLEYKTFEKVYPLYLKRENGEKISYEVTAITVVNQVYYFSLIKHLCQ